MANNIVSIVFFSVILGCICENESSKTFLDRISCGTLNEKRKKFIT